MLKYTDADRGANLVYRYGVGVLDEAASTTNGHEHGGDGHGESDAHEGRQGADDRTPAASTKPTSEPSSGSPGASAGEVAPPGLERRLIRTTVAIIRIDRRTRAMNFPHWRIWVWLLGLATGTMCGACKLDLGGAESSESSEKDDDAEATEKKKKRKKKKKKKKSGEEGGDGAEEVEVEDLFSESDDKSGGVLKDADLRDIDTSKAPRIGKRTAKKSPNLRSADWLELPGAELQIPNPKGWARNKEGNVGVIASPDKKALILFTTYETQEDLEKIFKEFGEVAKIQNVDWKKPRDVRLGQDSAPAVVRAGAMTTKSGAKGTLLYALVQTGHPAKVLALAMTDADIPKATRTEALNIIVSMRRTHTH